MANFYQKRFAKSETDIAPRDRVLDWRPPKDRSHESKYAYHAIAPVAVATVEKTLTLPPWHWSHDQGSEGSCVGHCTGMERAITNTRQNRLLSIISPVRRYDTIDIWNRAKERDEWSDTNPGDDNGTSVHAGYDVALNSGLCRVDAMELDANNIPHPVNPRPRSIASGITAVRWAASVDDMRTALANATPVAIGINWYTNFDHPVPKPPYAWPWIGEGDLGTIRGGHAICVFGASDKRQAFAIKNSWGAGYPLIWMPYTTMERVIVGEAGEAAISTDR